MNRVDIITAILISICILAVTGMSVFGNLPSDTAFGFISGIGVALIGNGVARGVDKKARQNNSQR